MNTVILPKNEYDSLIKSNREMDRRVRTVEMMVSDLARDEITPKYQAKLNKISRGVKVGKKVVLENASQIKKFFKNL